MANLDSVYFAYRSAGLAAIFNDAETYAAGFTFGMLPGNTQTALMDIYWQYARTSNGFLTQTQLWTQVTTGQWSAAVANIATWATIPTSRNQADSNLVLQDLNAGHLPTVGH